MKTVAALFKDLDSAQAAVAELEAAGVASDAISLISNQSSNLTTDLDSVESSIGGSAIGAAGGGALGLAAGIVMTPVAGLGILAVLGWAATALAGASAGVVAGGTAASLADIWRTSGSPEDESHLYTEGLRAGGTLVAVRVENGHDEVLRVLQITGGATTVPAAHDVAPNISFPGNQP